MPEMTNTASKQYVIFRLGKQEYGVDTLKVKHIEEMMPITRVPQTPSFIIGVINLRGDIIPVMDLRMRLNLPTVDATEDTRIIIIKINEISLGIIVDAVVEVIQLSDGAIDNIAGLSGDISNDGIIGVGKIGDRIVTLLNFEELVKI